MTSGELTTAQREKYAELRRIIGTYDSALVAWSGGVDSSLVAYVAGTTLGTRALAVTSGTPSLKRSDLSLAEYLANVWHIGHRVIMTDEIENPNYRANPVNRCYYCKTSLYEAMRRIADSENYAVILNGTNMDDLGDHRPGLTAADEHAVRSPLVEAGFTKADVRAVAAHLKLENANKPQSACLSSRFPYGTAIDRGKLAQVEAAENVLEALGFTQFRVRHHDDVARLEIDTDELQLALSHREQLQQAITALGYRFVALDLAGFKSGSLNAGIAVVHIHEP